MKCLRQLNGFTIIHPFFLYYPLGFPLKKIIVINFRVEGRGRDRNIYEEREKSLIAASHCPLLGTEPLTPGMCPRVAP